MLFRSAGKELVETPDQMYSARVQYEVTDWFQVGGQAKYTGERWLTDVNDMKVDAFTVVDFDARVDFAPLGYEGTFLQLNLTNAFDEKYYGGLGTRTSATPGQPGYGIPFGQIGAPRTFVATLRVAF